MATKKAARVATRYRVVLTYAATVIMESADNPADANFERDLALNAETYINPSTMELTDWKILPTRESDGSAANV